MKTSKNRLQRTPSGKIVLAILTCFTVFTCTSLRAEDKTSSQNSLADKERAVDKEHLLKIHSAIKAYEKDQGKLPAYLSDLFPKYLNDPEILMSPVEKRTGQSSLFGYGDPKMKSSYIYEFSGISSGRRGDNNTILTMQEWKTIQMESFGPVIPILRCHLHTPVLNVAYSGDLYETATLWESDPATVELMKKLGPGKGSKTGKILVVKTVTGEIEEEPVAGAEVTLSNLETALGAMAPRSVTTGEQGQAEIPLGNVRIQRMTVTAAKSGYATYKISWGEDNPANNIANNLPAIATIPLRKAATLGGSVQNQSHQPIAKARITVCGVTRDEVGQSIEVEYETVVTDAKGRWQCSTAPANQEFITLRVKHDHYLPAEYNMAPENNAEDKLLAKNDLLNSKAIMVLEPGIQVDGIVKNSDGKPLVEANITLLYGEKFAQKKFTKTDEEGRFLLVMLETCPAHLVAQAQGYAPQSIFTTVERGLKPIVFALDKGLTLKGETVDKDNRVLPQVQLRLVSWNDLPLLEWQTQSDAEGRFTWDSAPKGTLAIEAQSDGYYSTMQNQNIDSDTQFRFKLDKMWRVSGTVKDAETGKNIEKFRIIRGYNYGGPDDKQVYWENQETIQGANGAYNATQNYRRGGRIKLMALADGYLPSESPLFDDQGWHTHHFTLKKGEGPKGMVVSPNGEPIQNAQVALIGMGYMNLGKAAFRTYGEANEFMAKTDAEGRFSLPAVLASPTLIAVHEQGYAEFNGDELVKAPKVTLQPWAKVEGVLMFGTHPGTNESIMLTSDMSGMNRLNYDWENFRVTTDDQGRFAFNYVPPGDRSLVRLIQTSQNSWMHSHAEPITIKPGATHQLTYGGKGRPVIGKVSLSDANREVDWKNGHYSLSTTYPQPPKPFKNAEDSRAWYNSAEFKKAMKTHRSYSFRVNDDGTFRAENILPGKYQLNFDVREAEGSQPGTGMPIGNLHKDITVDEIPGGVTDEPMDLGGLVIPVRSAPNGGKR